MPSAARAPYVGVAGMWAGDPAEGERATRALRELATPLIDISGPIDYLEFQRSLDPFFPDGQRRYWKALYLDGFADAAIDRRSTGPTAARRTTRS